MHRVARDVRRGSCLQTDSACKDSEDNSEDDSEDDSEDVFRVLTSSKSSESIAMSPSSAPSHSGAHAKTRKTSESPPQAAAVQPRPPRGNASGSATRARIRVSHTGPHPSQPRGSASESATRARIRVSHAGPHPSQPRGPASESVTRACIRVSCCCHGVSLLIPKTTISLFSPRRTGVQF